MMPSLPGNETLSQASSRLMNGRGCTCRYSAPGNDRMARRSATVA